ncbi:transcription termination/antitermination protein NusG [Roseovarius sp. S4756]|uniref:transcription termination/antitermination protein NusG n=1 Tax=Roseovarius maritimus TaxID=3342637 RepID=UPI0037286468
MTSDHSTQDMIADWHLLLCKPNQNHIAFRHLSRLDVDLFMPQHMVERRWRGQIRIEQRPVFAGYIFFSKNGAGVHWSQLRSTPGVSQLVGFGQNGPACVPGEIVRGLMRRCDEFGVLQADNDLVAGDDIRITSGPFADFVTTIEHIDDEKRIHVLLDLLGAHTRVTLDRQRVVRQE